MAFRGDDHQVVGGLGGHVGHVAEHFTGAIVEDEEGARPALAVGQRHGQAQGWAMGRFEPAVFDIQVERRNVDAAGGQADAVAEVIAVGLVLQLRRRADAGLLAIVVDTDDFLAGRIKQADLVVGGASLGKTEEILGDAAEFLRFALLEVALQRPAGGDEAQIAADDEQSAVKHAGPEADVELLGRFAVAALGIAMAVGIEIADEHNDAGQWQEIAQEGEDALTVHRNSR